MLRVELVGGGEVYSVVSLGHLQGPLPQPGGLVEAVEEVVPAALAVQAHRVVQQPQLRRHLLLIPRAGDNQWRRSTRDVNRHSR